MESVNWEVSARSETGLVRDENQDRMNAVQCDWGRIFVVADGMGGHKAGALAAQLTVEEMTTALVQTPPRADVAGAIPKAFERANKTVYDRAHCGNPETHGMGSTAVLVLVVRATAHVAHVGDSRVYLYRNHLLERLTRDHTRVQWMVDSGLLSPAEAREHPDASLLSRAVGQKLQLEVDLLEPLELQNGDGILLCSDGLSGYVDDQAIEKVLRDKVAVQEVTDSLIQLALDAGGEDNVTVQFIQYGARAEGPTRARGGMLGRLQKALMRSMDVRSILRFL